MHPNPPTRLIGFQVENISGKRRRICICYQGEVPDTFGKLYIGFNNNIDDFKVFKDEKHVFLEKFREKLDFNDKEVKKA